MIIVKLLTLFIILIFVFAYYDELQKIQKEDNKQKQQNAKNRNS